MIANIRQLRSSTKEILSAVSRGAVVFISNRGSTCAKIVPVRGRPAGKSARVISLAGLWKDNKKTASPKKFIRKLRAPRYDH